MRELTVLCADPVQERRSHLAGALRDGGFLVQETDSAAGCVSTAASQKPDAVTLDSDLLHVDMENIAEYICRVSPATRVILTVDNALLWRNTPPYVSAVAAREDTGQIISLLQETFLADQEA
ncbi:MAG: hypothetical protein WAM79_23520 [Candidatus Sulfotelmatobacter sp.]